MFFQDLQKKQDAESHRTPISRTAYQNSVTYADRMNDILPCFYSLGVLSMMIYSTCPFCWDASCLLLNSSKIRALLRALRTCAFLIANGCFFLSEITCAQNCWLKKIIASVIWTGKQAKLSSEPCPAGNNNPITHMLTRQ